jgi:hypothetical protein
LDAAAADPDSNQHRCCHHNALAQCVAISLAAAMFSNIFHLLADCQPWESGSVLK